MSFYVANGQSSNYVGSCLSFNAYVPSFQKSDGLEIALE